MTCFVKKIEWEHGEPYGHVCYPMTLNEVRQKLDDLEAQAVATNYPFYVEVFFHDGSYIGFIVGHELSSFYFGIPAPGMQDDDPDRLLLDMHYDIEQEGNTAFIEYSFKGDHGEKYLEELLPKQQVIDALYQYMATRTLPPAICLTRQAFIDTYIRQ